jgi:hypothetical protein
MITEITIPIIGAKKMNKNIGITLSYFTTSKVINS